MPLDTLQSSVAGMSNNETIRLWVAHIRRHQSRGTHILYSRTIWRLKDFLPKQIEVFTLEHLERFLASMEPCSANSHNAYVTALQAFGRWLEEHGLPNPAKKLKRIHAERIPARVLTEEEYDKVVAICDFEERDTIQFLANTGLRADEFLRLKPQNLSSDGEFLHIIGKGGKPRSIPLNAVCQAAIARHPDMKLVKSYKALWRLCNDLGERAGISHFAPHSLRHFTATRLIKAGIPLYQISKLLGHSETRITEEIYLHWCQKDAVAGITNVLNK